MLLCSVSAHVIAVITNYEQALLWLGAAEDMDEGFLVSMYSVKVSISIIYISSLQVGLKGRIWKNSARYVTHSHDL